MIQVSLSPKGLRVDSEHQQHPAKSYMRAAKEIRRKRKKKNNNVASSTQPTLQVPTAVCMKSLRWIHITSQGVCAPEGDCPWCVHNGESFCDGGTDTPWG